MFCCICQRFAPESAILDDFTTLLSSTRLKRRDISAEWVERLSTFDEADGDGTQRRYLRLTYPARYRLKTKAPVTGTTFSWSSGVNVSAVEHFLLDRQMSQPGWIQVLRPAVDKRRN